MRNNEVNLISPQVVLFQYIAGRLVHGAHGKFEDFLALHLHEMVARGDGRGGGGVAAAALRDVKEVGAVAIGPELGADDTDARLGGTAENHGAGAVAKEHAGGAILPVHDG